MHVYSSASASRHNELPFWLFIVLVVEWSQCFFQLSKDHPGIFLSTSPLARTSFIEHSQWLWTPFVPHHFFIYIRIPIYEYSTCSVSAIFWREVNTCKTTYPPLLGCNSVPWTCCFPAERFAGIHPTNLRPTSTIEIQNRNISLQNNRFFSTRRYACRRSIQHEDYLYFFSATFILSSTIVFLFETFQNS